MNGTTKLIVMVTGLSLVLLTVWGWAGRIQLQSKIAVLEQENQNMRDDLQKVYEQGEMIDRMSEELDTLRARMENAIAETPVGGQDLDEQAMAPSMVQDLLAGMLGGMDMLQPDSEALQDGETETEFNMQGMSEMIQGFADNEHFQNLQTDMMINMQYGPFLDGYQFPADKEDAVRDILAMYAREEIRRAMDMIGGGGMPSSDEMSATEEETRQRLLADLAEVLSPEELAAFEAYEQDKEYYVLEQTFDQQMAMFAPGLHPETRELARAILAEEALYAQQQLRESDQMSPRASMDSSLEAMESARARLEDSLSPDEFRRIDRFITTMSDILSSSMAMFEGFAQGGQSSE